MKVSKTKDPITGLTPRQTEAWNIIIDFFGENDNLPSTYEVAMRMDCEQNAAMGFFRALEKQGYIEKMECLHGRAGKRFTEYGRSIAHSTLGYKKT